MNKFTSVLDLIKGVIALVGIGIAILLIGPFLLVWVINSLAESGGSGFYVEHSLWNYFVSFVFLVLVRGGSGSSK